MSHIYKRKVPKLSVDHSTMNSTNKQLCLIYCVKLNEGKLDTKITSDTPLTAKTLQF